jgi:dipeptidyl aminopeptidase/acylaminoacyl peptidase
MRFYSRMIRRNLLLITMIMAATGLFSGCNVGVDPTELPDPSIRIGTLTPVLSTTPTLPATETPTPNPLVTLTPTLSPTATPDPFIDLYIDSLATRVYGGGVLQDAGNLASPAGFTRKLFRYRSEGLNLYGFLNIPDGNGPFPVVIILHGFVETAQYRTVAYSARYADALAESGFLVIHPNLRWYAPSPDAPNQLGIGDTIDTLNLISLVRQQSGSEGMLKKADGERIALWGHSMGGGIVLRLLILDPQLLGGLLYASIHSDEAANLTHFKDDGRGVPKINAPPDALELISPATYLERIEVPLSIHHGDADAVVPVEWSQQLCEDLLEMGKDVECKIYPDQPHTFVNGGDSQFIERSVSFFKRIME